MVYKVTTFTTLGLEGYEITVEADSNHALPTIDIIGLPDAAIKEAKERIRSTLRNVGVELPRRKVLINLAPSDTKKIGTSFDIAMAVAVLLVAQEGQITGANLSSDGTLMLGDRPCIFLGELGLDGTVKRVNGILPAVISAMEAGYKDFFVPAENSYELDYIPGIRRYPIGHFSELVGFLIQGKGVTCQTEAKDINQLYGLQEEFLYDFAHIKWHAIAKRALTVAAAGLHNVLMVGSPGSGKTMLAKALHSILPPLGFEEILQVSQIYSVVGKLSADMPLMTQRPFRPVHHTASKISIVGWGQKLTPGEISLANRGILFFDEVPEFPRDVLEVLRQPMEDRVVTVSRAVGTVQYPAEFMFVGAMNPAPCGYYKDPEIECTDSLSDIKRYQGKVSWPLLDRIDMLLEIPREKVDTLIDSGPGESSASLREKVLEARLRQQKRFAGTDLVSNAQISSKNIEQYIPLSDDCKKFLKDAAAGLNLSGRVLHRVMKLARTVADVAGAEDVAVAHLAEALQYRNKNMFIEA